jgi:hypothetical protein
MVTMTQPTTLPLLTVGSCAHGNGQFSLTINAENRHVDLRAYSYDHKPGHTATFVIFDLTIRDMIQLAHDIIGEAHELSAPQNDDKQA